MTIGGVAARSLRSGLVCTVLGLTLWSCTRSDLMNDYDPASGASKKDYEKLIGRRGQDAQDAAKEGAEPPIPAFQSVLAAPGAPELADTRRVSIAVTETTPLRDILIELARRAEVDLELDPRISGGIIMTATDRPFIDVIDRICDLAELRYKFERNILKVETDDPYLEQYRMDVLNQTRNSSGSVTSSTDASSAAQSIGSGGGGGGGNNSKSSIDIQSSTNFWSDIGKSIDQILSSIQSRRGRAIEAADLKASFDPDADMEDEDEDAPAAGGGPLGALAQAAAGAGAGGAETPALEAGATDTDRCMSVARSVSADVAL